MNCVLFDKMDPSLVKKTKHKNTGKIREFFQSKKVGTMFLFIFVFWNVGKSWGPFFGQHYHLLCNFVEWGRSFRYKQKHFTPVKKTDDALYQFVTLIC